jgi:Polyketide cyclase / dehydrase and lipid transport
MSSLLVSRSKQVNASAAAIFELLADPARHSEIDGSGTVQGPAVEGPSRLFAGARFGMKMRLGVPYRITNVVTEFVESRSIAWRHFGGHTWRYQLEPVNGGAQTLVTETFDGTTSRFPPALVLMKAPQRNAQSIEATLDRLAARFG